MAKRVSQETGTLHTVPGNARIILHSGAILQVGAKGARGVEQRADARTGEALLAVWPSVEACEEHAPLLIARQSAVATFQRRQHRASTPATAAPKAPLRARTAPTLSPGTKETEALSRKVALLEAKVEEIAGFLPIAVSSRIDDPHNSLAKCRIVAEKLLLRLYRPRTKSDCRKVLLGDMLNDNQFTRTLPADILAQFWFVTNLGNLGAHGERGVTPANAQQAIDAILQIVAWFLDESQQKDTVTPANPVPASGGSDRADNSSVRLIMKPPSSAGNSRADVAVPVTDHAVAILKSTENSAIDRSERENTASSPNITSSYAIASALPNGRGLIGLFPDVASRSNEWRFEPVTDATEWFFIILATASGLCLDACERRTDNGTPVILYKKNGGEHQQWRPDRALSGSFCLVNRKSGRCLDIDQPTGRLNLWDYHGGENQQWLLTPCEVSRWSIMLVIGSGAVCDQYDRPVAEKLRDVIHAKSLASAYCPAVVINDETWHREITIQNNPVIAVGGPFANALAREIIGTANCSNWDMGPGQHGCFRQSPGKSPQVVLWGDDARGTCGATEQYAKRDEGLPALLEMCWPKDISRHGWCCEHCGHWLRGGDWMTFESWHKPDGCAAYTCPHCHQESPLGTDGHNLSQECARCKDIRLVAEKWYCGSPSCHHGASAQNWMERELVNYPDGQAFYACPKCHGNFGLSPEY